MEARFNKTLWRLLHVVAPQRPHVVNGLVSSLLSKRVGRGNPILPLLKIPTDFNLRSQDVDPGEVRALIYDNYAVRYAVLSLCHMVDCGLYKAYAHILRLLDVIVNSREDIALLEPDKLYMLLMACYKLRCRACYFPRRMRYAGATQIFNAVMENSLTCANYVCNRVAASCDSHEIGLFASVIVRMGLGCDPITKSLAQQLANNAAHWRLDSLMGALEYLVCESRKGSTFCYGPICSIFDVMVKQDVKWEQCVLALQYMAELNITHTPLVDRIVTELLQYDAENDICKMDAIDSSDICIALGALSKLECEQLVVLTEALVDRYIPYERGKPKEGKLYRDLVRCSVTELLHLLNAILLTFPTIEGNSLVWLKYLLQKRIPMKMAFATSDDIEALFRCLCMVNPDIYHGILIGGHKAPWIPYCGRVSVTSVVSSMITSLEPETLARVVLCYSLSYSIDNCARRMVSECIHAMCSKTLAMLSNSSSITRQTKERLLELNGKNELLLLEPRPVKLPSMIKDIAGDSTTSFLYDPAAAMNFKYMKRGENRQGLLKPMYRYRGPLRSNVLSDSEATDSTGERNMENEMQIKSYGMCHLYGYSSSSILKAMRSVYRSLWVHYHLGHADSYIPYDGFNLEELDSVKSFLKMYDYMTAMFSSKYDALDSGYTIYAIDKKSDSKLKRATQKNHLSHVDPRLLCTSTALQAYTLERNEASELRFCDARLRRVSMGIFKPQLSKVKLNWSHIDESEDMRTAVRTRRPRMVASAMLSEMSRVSQQVDNALRGHRERVEYYDDFISNQFKEGLVWHTNREAVEGYESQQRTSTATITSRMHKDVFQAISTMYGCALESEVKCGPYFIDIECRRNDSSAKDAAYSYQDSNQTLP